MRRAFMEEPEARGDIVGVLWGCEGRKDGACPLGVREGNVNCDKARRSRVNTRQTTIREGLRGRGSGGGRIRTTVNVVHAG